MDSLSNSFRLGITGLPGSGKTSLAYRMAPVARGPAAKRIALLEGDKILAENIIPICRNIDRFVVEHFCLTQILSDYCEKLVDAMVFLNISPAVCETRCCNRKNHIVEKVNFEKLYEEIQEYNAKLVNRQNLLACTINLEQQKHILNYDLKKDKLIRFLFPNSHISEVY